MGTAYFADHESVRLFGSPQGAYMWAVEVLSRPGVQSPDGKRIGGSGGGPSREDVETEAMAILQAVNRIPNRYDKAAFKFVYTDRFLGAGERGSGISEEDAASFASTVAEQVARKHTDVSYGRISAIAGLCVKRVREKYRGTNRRDGKTEFPQELIAFRAGLSGKSSLHTGPWMLIIADCEREFRAAVKRGKRAAAQELRELGVLPEEDRQ